LRKVAPVYGMVLPLNIGSKQVLECVGYAFTKYYLDHGLSVPGAFVSTVYYTINGFGLCVRGD